MKANGMINRPNPQLRIGAALAALLLIGCGGSDTNLPDTTNPTVISTFPSDGAVQVAFDAGIQIVFSEAMDSATINGTTVKVRAGASEVTGTIICAYDTVTFIPANNWDSDTTYTVTILGGSSGPKDMAGHPLEVDYTFMFSTQTTPNYPPSVLSTIPVNGAAGVSVDTTVAATFSKGVTNVTSATFRLSAGTYQVPGTVTKNELVVDNSVWMFVPASPLSHGVTYTASVTTGVTDLDGNPLPADYKWTFTTGLDPTPPTVAGTNPALGTLGVSVNTTVTASFSEDVTNVDSTTFLLRMRSDTGDVTVPGVVIMSGSTATFSPLAPLEYDKNYIATLTQGITDLSGNPLAVGPYGYNWYFHTIEADPAPPAVTGTNPEDGATGVSVLAPITVNFSEVVTNLIPNGFVLMEGTTPVPWRIDWRGTAGQTAVFSPIVPLDFETTYTALVKKEVTDMSGIPMTADYTWKFTTGPNPMEPATVISSGMEDAMMPRLAMDASGVAVAVWVQGEGIWSNRYEPGTGWSEAIQIGNGFYYGLVEVPQVAMDGKGNAIAVWYRDGIWSNRYASGTGWSTAVRIDSGESGRHPSVAMDSDGNAVAVWTGSPETIGQAVWSARYTPGAGWTIATVINGGMDTVTYARIAMNGNGNAIAIWRQGDGYRYNRYSPATGWETASELDNCVYVLGEGFPPKVVMDDDGNAVAVWSCLAGTMKANRYVPGTGWEEETLLDPSPIGLLVPGPDPIQMAMDGGGNAIVAWNELIGGNGLPIIPKVYAKRYVPGEGWGNKESVISEVYVGTAFPTIAMSPGGNAVVAWSLSRTSQTPWHIVAKRYVSGTGWETPILMETSAENAIFPNVATDGNGSFIIVWQQWDGMRYIISAVRYQEP